MNIDYTKDEFKDLSPEAKVELAEILKLYQPVLAKLNTMSRSDDLTAAKTQLEDSFEAAVKSVADAATQMKADADTTKEEQDAKKKQTLGNDVHKDADHKDVEDEDGQPLDITDTNDSVNKEKGKK